MVLVGRGSEGGGFVHGFLETGRDVGTGNRIRSITCMHTARVGSLRAVGAVGKLLATKRSKAWSGC
jgi:hypothetical protein